MAYLSIITAEVSTAAAAATCALYAVLKVVLNVSLVNEAKSSSGNVTFAFTAFTFSASVGLAVGLLVGLAVGLPVAGVASGEMLVGEMLVGVDAVGNPGHAAAHSCTARRPSPSSLPLERNQARAKGTTTCNNLAAAYMLGKTHLLASIG